MTGSAGATAGRRRNWRTPAVLAASLALHAAVLGYLGLRAIEMDGWQPGDQPDILIEIEPRPLLAGERPRRPSLAAPRADEAVARSGATAQAAIGRVPAEEEDEDETSSPTLPVPGAAAPGPVPRAGPGAWPALPPRSAGIGRGLRGGMVRCDVARGRLSPSEQSLCDDQFADAALGAAPIRGSGNARRDAAFAAQGERELAAYESRRRAPSGGTGIVPLGDCPGSNFGAGCPGAHLEPGWRRDNNDVMNDAQGRGRSR
ncbi:hypothetical protein [Brevundimonas sp.]|uniref:hypothetical protein n=1 Tax=Brevundimonas sp. TaxID=1871086 RepID=UPI00260C682F|nr:hypothetical protein [Brevundimonas sp.]